MMTRFRDLMSVFFLAFSIFLYVTSYQIRLTKADPIGRNSSRGWSPC